MDDAWEVGERQGVRWRRVGTVLLGVAVVAGLTWLALGPDEELAVDTDNTPVPGATEEPEVVVTSPQAAGDRWLCPNDFRVRAYDTGEYFPPQHPAPPAFTVRPADCFAAPSRAEAAGYTLAPPPSDAQLIGEIYLIPTRRPARDACVDVAGVVGFAVPCPTVLPSPAEAASCLNSCLFSGTASHFGVVIEQRGVTLPVDWCADCDGRLVLTAVRDRAPPELIACGPDMAQAALAMDAIAGYHDCPDGPPWLPGMGGFPHESHTLLVWEEGPRTYALSMPGHGEPVRAVLAGVQEGIELIAPPAT